MGILLTVFLIDIVVWIGLLYKIFNLPSGQAQMEVMIMIIAFILLVFSSLILFVQNDKKSSPDILTYLVSIVGLASVLYSISVLFS